MDTWERFSRALEEAKRVEEECGCEESDTKPKKKTASLNAINTDINNAKNKLRSMGLKMSQELEGEQLDEDGYMSISAGGKTITRNYSNTPSDYSNVSVQDNTPSSPQRKVTTPSRRPTTPTAPKPTATTTPKPAAQRPQTASAALAQGLKGVPFLGDVANIANRYDRASNYRGVDPEIRKQMGLQKEENISEMSVSRAQQRFMGMVRAEQEGKMKNASPAVKKAAKSMTAQQAHDFAATKHAGLPEKKETKEELSLVDKMITEFSINLEDLSEAPKDTISGGTSKSKKYKTQAKGVRAAQMGSAAMSGDMEEVQRLGQTKSTVKKKKTSKPSQEPENTSETSTKKSKSGRGMSAKTAAERAAAIRAAARTKSKQIEAKARLAAEKEKTARQQARFERSDAEKAKREKESAGDAAEKAYREKTQKRRQNRAELRKALKGSGATATSKQTDLDVLSAMGSNVGSAVKGLVGYGIKRYQQNKDERNIAKLRKDAESKASESQSKNPESSDSPKTPKALKAGKSPTDSKIVPVSVKDATPKSLPMGINKRKMLPPSTQGSTRVGQPATGTRPQIPGSQKRKQIEAGTYKPIKSIGEKYSNWREELIIEIDDPSVTNDQPERIIDVSKKKNKIEINPKLSEQRQHLREFLPALLAALEIGGGEAAAGLAARSAAAGAGEAAAAGETSAIGSKVKDLLKGKSQDLITKKQKKPGEDPTTASSSQSDLDALSAMASNIKKEGFSDWRSELSEASAAWQRKEGKNPEGGLNKKGIASYRREHPGSHLSLAVTTKPSKLKKGSKKWKRRKSFCARMSGMPGPMKDVKGRPTRKALSLRKWNC